MGKNPVVRSHVFEDVCCTEKAAAKAPLLAQVQIQVLLLEYLWSTVKLIVLARVTARVCLHSYVVVRYAWHAPE